MYERIQKVSIVWQKLTYLASLNDSFIYSVYSQIANSDPLVSNLVRIKKLKEHEKHNSLVLTRVDYFLNQDSEAKIIEYNLISVSMSAHSQNYQEAKRLTDKSHPAY